MCKLNYFLPVILINVTLNLKLNLGEKKYFFYFIAFFCVFLQNKSCTFLILHFFGCQKESF